jgi:YebC/PmpR family DNA-binding regulatory protein
MPKDNIDRAIKKGTGELEGSVYEELTYEGYGPGGVAVMAEVLTDNKNRAAAEIRHIFSKNAGNLGDTGCVGWMFTRKGTIVYEKGTVDEEKLMDIALEAGADDVTEDESTIVVTTDPKSFYAVKEEIDKRTDLPAYVVAEIAMIPQNTVELTGKEAEQMLRMMEALEDSDDVQNVYSNFDIPDELMNKQSNHL